VICSAISLAASAAVALVAYVFYACAQLDVSWERVQIGLGNAAHFFDRLFPPNFERWELLAKGLKESLEIAVLASTLGIVLALPIGLFAARNLMPTWATWPARFIIVSARSFHPVIVAILFVAMVGFGPLAGMLTLSFATIGFLAKLLAEDIEDTDPAQLEAVRATGASWAQIVNYAVQPQVMPRLIGLSLYRFDINFRESAVIGIVGGGGIGATLFTAFQRFDYDFVLAILIAIISLIMAGELLATGVRAIFIGNATLGDFFRRGHLLPRERLRQDD